MFRTIIAGAAVAGALTFGAVGVAGASTPATGATGANKAALCAKLPALQAKVQKAEAKVATWLPKAQARGRRQDCRQDEARRRHRRPDHQGPES